MRRLMLFVLGVLLAVPSLAHAWTIAARVGTASGSISGGYPTRLTVSNSTTVNMTVPGGDATVTVTPAPGYTVSSVTVDGALVAAPATGGDVVIPQGGKTYRTLVANFKVATYTMTIVKAPYGNISMQLVSPTTGAYTQTSLSNLRMGYKVKVMAAPNTGYQVNSVTIGGTKVWTGPSQGMVTYIYTVGTSSVNVSADISILPTAHAWLTVDSTTGVINSAIGLSAASSTTNDTPLTYTFRVTSANGSKANIQQATPTSPTATFQASAAESYTVNVTVTSPHGATDTTANTTITLQTVGDWNSGVCASCHTNRDALLSSQYKQSVHSISGGIGCPQCHNPTGDIPHPHIVSPIDSCQPCHASATPTVVNDYVAGPHNNPTSVCTACHSDHSEHADVTICKNCHGDTLSGNGNHSQFVSDPTICVKCHNMHNPHSGASAYHFNGYTSYANPKYHAAYVTPRTTCSNCHFTTTLDGSTFAAVDQNYSTIRQQWAASGHGDATSAAWKNTPNYDWKTLGSADTNLQTSASAVDCVRCHTGKGFLKYEVYSSGTVTPVGIASDKSSEPLACTACHNPGFVDTEAIDKYWNVRYTKVLQIGPVTSYYNYSTAGFKLKTTTDDYTYDDSGDSNICISCHSGTVLGRSITLAKAAGLNFSNAAFFDSHAMAAAPVLYNLAGYKFPGQAYNPTNSHWDGVAQGACVMCHMDNDKKGTEHQSTHSFKPLIRDKDKAGSVVAIASTYCIKCHSGGYNFLDAAQINNLSDGFQASLKILETMLADKNFYNTNFRTKNFYYKPNVPPYFFNTSTSTSKENAVRDWTDANTMGAAFNLNLFTKEKGAYAHSPQMTKELLYDCVDYLDDGLFNGTAKQTVTNIILDHPEYSAADPYLFTTTRP